MYEFPQLLVPLPSQAAPNRQDVLHIAIEQAFAQNTLPDHPRRPKEKNVHLFNFSLTCHEAAHALAAQWGGDPTAAKGGQVTLNPLPHIRREIFGTIIAPILSYVLGGWMIGWGSAPYDPHWSYRHPHRAAWMALAGPAANVLLMLVAVPGIRVGILTGALVAPESARFTRVVAAAGLRHPPFSSGNGQKLEVGPPCPAEDVGRVQPLGERWTRPTL